MHTNPCPDRAGSIAEARSWGKLGQPRGFSWSMVVSSWKKQQAGMTHKLASPEPKASWSSAETEKRSEVPKTQLAAGQPLLVQASFGGATVRGHTQRGAPHQGICLPLKQTLSCGGRSQAAQVAPHAKRSGLHRGVPAGSELTFRAIKVWMVW